MCRVERERSEEREDRRKMGRRWVVVMGLKTVEGGEVRESRVEKLRSSMVSSRPRMKLWLIRATTSVLLWTCLVQLTALGEMWGPRVLKGWPSCFSQDDTASAVSASASLDPKLLSPSVPERILPPKSEFVIFYICLYTKHIYIFLVDSITIVEFLSSDWLSGFLFLLKSIYFLNIGSRCPNQALSNPQFLFFLPHQIC